MPDVNMAQAIMQGAALSDSLKDFRLKEEERQIKRQYLREDAARQREYAQAQLANLNITNRSNAIAADSAEFQLEELRKQANIRDRANLHKIIKDTFNNAIVSGKSSGYALQSILNDKSMIDEMSRLYPNMDWQYIRPVDLSMVNPEVITNKIKEIAQTNALKRNEGLVQNKSMVDGKEAINYIMPEITPEDYKYAQDSLVVVSDNRTGDIKLFDGNIFSSIMFGDIITEAEYNRQQEALRQQLFQQNIDNSLKLAEADAKSKEIMLKEANLNKELQNRNLALSSLQDPQVKSVSGGGLDIQKYASDGGGVSPVQAQQNANINREMFRYVDQGLNPYTQQPFVDSKEMLNTIQSIGSEFMSSLKNQGLSPTEAAKQYEQQITPYLRQIVVNGEIEDATNAINLYYSQTGKQVDDKELAALKSLKTTRNYLTNPDKLTSQDVGVLDTPIRRILSMVSDMLPEGKQKEIYKKEMAELGDSGLLTAVMTASLGSQLTKNELKLYNLSPSLFDSYVRYRAKLETALNDVSNRAEALVNSDDAMLSAEGELLLRYLDNYKTGLKKLDAFTTAYKDFSYANPFNWGKSKNNLEEVTITNNNNEVFNTKALANARAKGRAILFKSNGKYYFIPATNPGNTSTIAEPILISEQEAQQLRQYKVD